MSNQLAKVQSSSSGQRLPTRRRTRQASKQLGGPSAEQGLPTFTHPANINAPSSKPFGIWAIQQGQHCSVLAVGGGSSGGWACLIAVAMPSFGSVPGAQHGGRSGDRVCVGMGSPWPPLPPLCVLLTCSLNHPPTRLSFQLSTMSCPHEELAMLSCPTMTWQ